MKKRTSPPWARTYRDRYHRRPVLSLALLLSPTASVAYPLDRGRSLSHRVTRDDQTCSPRCWSALRHSLVWPRCTSSAYTLPARYRWRGYREPRPDDFWLCQRWRFHSCWTDRPARGEANSYRNESRPLEHTCWTAHLTRIRFSPSSAGIRNNFVTFVANSCRFRRSNRSISTRVPSNSNLRCREKTLS